MLTYLCFSQKGQVTYLMGAEENCFLILNLHQIQQKANFLVFNYGKFI